MLNVNRSEGWYLGMDADGAMIPTPEFRRSLARFYGPGYKEPACFSNPVARGCAFDAAPRDDGRLNAEDAQFFRGILARLKGRRRRGADRHDDDHDQVAADSNQAFLDRGVAETQRAGAAGFRAGDLADLQGAPRPIPEPAWPSAESDHRDEVRHIAADTAPESDLKYYQNAALAVCGGR
jgi:hypothetical protein